MKTPGGEPKEEDPVDHSPRDEWELAYCRQFADPRGNGEPLDDETLSEREAEKILTVAELAGDFTPAERVLLVARVGHRLQLESGDTSKESLECRGISQSPGTRGGSRRRG